MAVVQDTQNPATRRQKYVHPDDFPEMTRAYMQLSQVVRETGLLKRAHWFYGIVAAALALSLGGIITGFVLLSDSWFQLLIAAALGIWFTQVAFVAHEAAHRQILAAGPKNDRLAGLLIGIVGMSYSWWVVNTPATTPTRTA